MQKFRKSSLKKWVFYVLKTDGFTIARFPRLGKSNQPDSKIINNG
ncbi:hypothetical protein [Mucilaginibacter ginsenosidivorax]|nr:hypothetical protein [Mucilaginibacter ginsenosidivorax]